MGTVWLEERLSVCERWLIVWRWICSTHTTSGLCGCGGGVPGCAVLFVDFQWASGGRSKFLEEWASLSVLLWVCSASGPASSPLSI